MKTIHIKKFSIIFIFSLLAVMLLFPGTAFARGANVKDTVNQGEVIDQNTFLVGTTVKMDGVINGDLLAIGDDISISGQVNGDLAVIAKNVWMNGQVSGNVYISSVYLTVGPQASVERDVYFIGNSINTQSGSTINRDLNALGFQSELTGNVNRKVNTLIGPVLLVQKLYDYLVSKGWWPKSLQIGPRSFQDEFGKQPKIGMAFGLTALHDVSTQHSSSVNGKLLSVSSKSQLYKPANAIDVPRVQAWATSLLKNLVTLLILGLLIAWLASNQLGIAAEQARIKPWRALLNGLLVFVLGWLVALLALILVLALAFFFYWISLPNLGFFVGAFGLIAIGLALSLFWLSIAYISKIIVAYLVGLLIFKRFIPSFAQSRVWPLVAGLILYAVLASIPYLGWLIAVLSTLIGLGAMWMLTGKRQAPESKPVEQLPAVDDRQELNAAQEA